MASPYDEEQYQRKVEMMARPTPATPATPPTPTPSPAQASPPAAPPVENIAPATAALQGEEPIQIRSTAGARTMVPVPSSLPGAAGRAKAQEHGGNAFGYGAGKPVDPAALKRHISRGGDVPA